VSRVASTGGWSPTSIPMGVALSTRSHPAGSGLPVLTCPLPKSASSSRSPATRASSASWMISWPIPASRSAIAIALPAPPAPTRSARAPVIRAPRSCCALTKASPSSTSPRQVPSALRRMTLTTPSILARAELVAQCSKAANLCGIVTRMPSTFGVAVRPAITTSRSPSGTSIGIQIPLWPRAAKVRVSHKGD
jgi:hypothetical protein